MARFSLYKKEASNAILVKVDHLCGGGENCRYAGKVEVDIDGVTKTETVGTLEKNELVPFRRLEFKEAFPYRVDGNKKINVKVKWTLYQLDISITQQDEEIPESLMSQGQGSLSKVRKAIMTDEKLLCSR